MCVSVIHDFVILKHIKHIPVDEFVFYIPVSYEQDK